LRAVCADCTQTLPFEDPRLLGKVETEQKLESLAQRIGSPNPLRRSDDGEHWDWRAFLRERRRD
jgi:hypothetical protein